MKPNENKSSGGEKKDKKDIEKPNQTHEEASTQVNIKKCYQCLSYD